MVDNMLDKVKEIEQRRKHLKQGGGPKAIERLHEATKLFVRERLDKLLDNDSLQEIDLWIRPIKTGFDIDERELPADAVVTGIGRVHNRPVVVYAHDFTVLGGTFGLSLHYKVDRAMGMARESGLPIIGVVDSGGERIHKSFSSGGGAFGGNGLYFHPGISSGVVPQITVMLGPSYAGSAYSPTMADFYIMRHKTAFMSVASPQLLKSVTYKDVTQEEIGGAELHTATTGNADFLAETDEEALEICRELLSYLPLNNRESPPVVDTGDDPNRKDDRLLEIVPADLAKPYDMHEIIRCIVDNGQFLEIQKLFVKSIIIGFARLNGHSVGIVANNPAENGGALNINTSDKEARFIRFCDCFNIPLIFLVDTPGFLSDAKDSYGALEEQSMNGLLRTAPKPAFAISEATVPIVTVYIGKCSGTARLMMGTTRMGVDFTYSWPCAQVARMAPEDAAEIIYKEEISSSKTPDDVRREKLAELLKKYYNYPYSAAGQAMVNEIIDPRDTRPLLIKTLENMAHKKPTPRPWRKHSLIPR
ncbi:acyl-CoA carboxylase subunit beta [Chloroflexota bacterium]